MNASGQTVAGPAITTQDLGTGILQLTFDQPGSSANVFGQALLKELDAVLDREVSDPSVHAVIFCSAKASIFIAGADIRELASVKSHDEMRAMIQLGQRVFQRIIDLPQVTVAAIHGACLGGGYELCLACDIRVASDDRATSIGLPETSLGIVPAWGGCTRLAPLIGLPNALDVIMGGKRLAAKAACKRGMVDEVVPKEHLIRAACRAIEKGTPNRRRHIGVNNGLVARFVAGQAQKRALARTRGHYPAVERALSIVTQSLSGPPAASLKREEEAIIELSATETCRNLIGIYFLQERSKRLSLSPGDVEVPQSAAVIGAGAMGAGIAQWLSSRGHPVILRDIANEALLKGLATAQSLFTKAVKRHILNKTAAQRAMDRIIPSAVEVSLKQTDIVIEAAVEKMDLKQAIFVRLGELSRPDTILATNTSALAISEIAQGVRHPERVIGIHFFNPVHRMQLVEIVVGKRTDAAVTERALRFVQGIGKLPVVVKDSPGFLVNRILMPYLIEAGRLFEAGAATASIDDAMLNFGMPMGPLRLLDEIGIDVAFHVAEHLSSHWGERMPVPDVLAGLVKQKWLGRKSGEGFYRHGPRDKVVPNPALQAYVQSGRAAELPPEKLAARMVLMAVNEAARCLEEGVVTDPADVDFAMIMGTGFAPFRGGPLRYADSLGIAQVVDLLRYWAEREGAHFLPCSLLNGMAADRQTFYTGETS